MIRSAFVSNLLAHFITDFNRHIKTILMRFWGFRRAFSAHFFFFFCFFFKLFVSLMCELARAKPGKIPVFQYPRWPAWWPS